MTRLGWFKFYPGDWNGDIELASCSLAAQGLFSRLLNVLHRADPYGFLLTNGKKPAPETISRVLGVEKEEYETCLAELIKKGVLKQNETGIYNARMVHDQQKREDAKRRGAMGGNPVLVNLEDNLELNPEDNHQVKAELKLEIEKEKETGYGLTSFEEFWKTYPRKVEKQKAYRVWKTRMREGVDPQTLIRTAANYAEAMKAKGTAQHFLKHPATFLGPDKPYEEWAQFKCENEGGYLVDKSPEDLSRCGCPSCLSDLEKLPAALAAAEAKGAEREQRMDTYLQAYTEWEASGFQGEGPELPGKCKGDEG